MHSHKECWIINSGARGVHESVWWGWVTLVRSPSISAAVAAAAALVDVVADDDDDDDELTFR